MTSEELQAMLETVIHAEVRAIGIRIDAMDKANLLQTTELMRRLEELNHSADRRSALEREDRERYVQEAEFEEAKNENLTWRGQIEKELRAFPRTTDVQQWVAVLQTRSDTTADQVVKNTKRLDAGQVEEELRARTRTAQQWKLVAAVGFVSTLLSALTMLMINSWIGK